MEIPYTGRIDMWSLGCLAVELVTGQPLFPGNTAKEQLALIVQMLGMPPEYMIK